MVDVVAAYIEKDGKFLIAQRASGEFKGLWEFPGGKVEINESDEEAIEREIREELEINIKAQEFIISNVSMTGNKGINLKLYRCKYIDGDIKLNEHLKYKYIKIDEADNFKFCPVDIKIIAYLKDKEF